MSNITPDAVNAAVEVFSIKDGRANIPIDHCPREALIKTLKTIADAFELKVEAGLDLASQEVLHIVLQAMFDTDTQDFLEHESSNSFANLTPEERDRILAQAIASATAVFSRLAKTGETITHGLLNREAQLYAESEQRSITHDAIEGSYVFDHCNSKQQISEMILEAMEAEEPASPQALAVDESLDFSLNNTNAASMGLPVGFHVMAIN